MSQNSKNYCQGMPKELLDGTRGTENKLWRIRGIEVVPRSRGPIGISVYTFDRQNIRQRRMFAVETFLIIIIHL